MMEVDGVMCRRKICIASREWGEERGGTKCCIQVQKGLRIWWEYVIGQSNKPLPEIYLVDLTGLKEAYLVDLKRFERLIGKYQDLEVYLKSTCFLGFVSKEIPINPNFTLLPHSSPSLIVVLSLIQTYPLYSLRRLSHLSPLSLRIISPLSLRIVSLLALKALSFWLSLATTSRSRTLFPRPHSHPTSCNTPPFEKVESVI